MQFAFNHLEQNEYKLLSYEPTVGYAGRSARPDLRQGPKGPQPQSSQVRFMRTLLVSVDLTSGKASATGGCPRFVSGPVIGEITWRGEQTASAS